MQDYKIVAFSNTENQNDILIALLSQLDFESFEEVDENNLSAYISASLFNQTDIDDILEDLPNFKQVTFHVSDLENKNWNEEWEKSFQPIIIEGLCQVRAPFHSSANLDYELLIEPKMAFGTGHHATTEMMLKLMLGIDFENKIVLDFGAGTGILSLLASKKKAKEIIANDIEEEAYKNMIENFALNACNNITPLCGGIKVVPNKKFDLVLANVTTNIIKENFEDLLSKLKENGEILFSGILKDQSIEIENLAKHLTLKFKLEQNNWIALHYKK